jgi:probable F420-dependent oxidoreductase
VIGYRPGRQIAAPSVQPLAQIGRWLPDHALTLRTGSVGLRQTLQVPFIRWAGPPAGLPGPDSNVPARLSLLLVLLGLVHVNMLSMSQPGAIAEAVRAAEAAGFDSVWAGEHIVLPDPRVRPSPLPPGTPILDSLLALSWAAAHTATIRLATGIVILPQRNPLVLAKQVATLDVLSGGRVMLGVGAGYLEPEFRAVGASLADRGAITDEYLDAMQALLYDEHPRHDGRFASFSGVDAYPRPVQQPIPLVVGGESAPAYRRAVARGHGWYGYNLTPHQVRDCLDGLAAAASQVERPADLGELEISVTPHGTLTPALAAEFADVGVHRLVPLAEPDGPARTIDAAAAAIAAL